MVESFFWLEPGAALNSAGFNSLMGYAGLTLLVGGSGLEMPTVRRSEEVIAGVPGTRVRTVEHDARTFDVAVLLNAGSEAQLRDVIRTWRRRFDPKRGDGQLWCATADGKALVLTCRYVQGLEGDESNRYSDGMSTAVLTFKAADPYWWDVLEQGVGWTLGGVIPKWFDPNSLKGILPISLAPSSFQGQATIVNVGEVDTWPRWLISGPAENVSVTNRTTDRTFTWSSTLADTDQLVVDTRPGVKDVLLGGVPAFGALTAFDLFPFVPGANDLLVTVSGSTAASRVDASWRNGYLGR